MNRSAVVLFPAVVLLVLSQLAVDASEVHESRTSGLTTELWLAGGHGDLWKTQNDIVHGGGSAAQKIERRAKRRRPLWKSILHRMRKFSQARKQKEANEQAKAEARYRDRQRRLKEKTNLKDMIHRACT